MQKSLSRRALARLKYMVRPVRARAARTAAAGLFGLSLASTVAVVVGPQVAGAAYNYGQGYQMYGSDGGVFTHGNASYEGSIPSSSDHIATGRKAAGATQLPTGKGYCVDDQGFSRSAIAKRDFS